MLGSSRGWQNAHNDYGCCRLHPHTTVYNIMNTRQFNTTKQQNKKREKKEGQENGLAQSGGDQQRHDEPAEARERGQPPVEEFAAFSGLCRAPRASSGSSTRCRLWMPYIAICEGRKSKRRVCVLQNGGKDADKADEDDDDGGEEVEIEGSGGEVGKMGLISDDSGVWRRVEKAWFTAEMSLIGVVPLGSMALEVGSGEGRVVEGGGRGGIGEGDVRGREDRLWAALGSVGVRVYGRGNLKAHDGGVGGGRSNRLRFQLAGSRRGRWFCSPLRGDENNGFGSALTQREI